MSVGGYHQAGMKSAAFFDTDSHEKKIIKKSLSDKAKLLFFTEPLTEANVGLVKDGEIASGFIYSRFPKEILEKLPNLKFIATQSTGFDHIDLDYCRKKGIGVANVPAYGDNTVAEHTFALILALSRRLPECWERVRRGEFTPEGLTGFDLAGKTLGVVGTGKIGRHVIRIARGLAMRVLATDVSPDPKLAGELGFTYVDFEELLSQSDIVTLHVPLVKETTHFLNEKTIGLMKRGALIINTARGGLIDTNALYEALESGQLGGAGLDVLEEEGFLQEERELLFKDEKYRADLKTVLQNHRLANHPRVVMTPHNAFNSREALDRILQTTIANVAGYLAGQPVNLVS